MHLNSVTFVLLAIPSFVIGSLLIIYGTFEWVTNLGFTFGLFGLLPYAPLGALLVFISLPTALFGFKPLPRWASGAESSSDESQEEDDDSLLFSNKRVVGLSLVITGTAWLILCMITFTTVTLFTPYQCPVNHCPTVITVFLSPESVILIAIGLLILAAGLVLVSMSKRKRQSRQQSIKMSLATLRP